jgi:polyisoprenoid-binding protein YceI
MAWQIDPVHTQIEFAAKYMMATTVKGQFKKFSGVFNFNEQNPEKSDFEVTIETASLDTGNDYRDGHLKSADFFDVEHFPTITYKSKKIEKLNDTHYLVTGDLTIRGVTHELPLKITYGGLIPKDMRGNRRVMFSTKATISRKKWGLTWNVALETGGWLVSDKITIGIEAHVVEPAAVPAQS